MYWGNQNNKSLSTYKETGHTILVFYQSVHWGNQNNKSLSTYKETGHTILVFYQIVKRLGKIHLLHN